MELWVLFWKQHKTFFLFFFFCEIFIVSVFRLHLMLVWTYFLLLYAGPGIPEPLFPWKYQALSPRTPSRNHRIRKSRGVDLRYPNHLPFHYWEIFDWRLVVVPGTTNKLGKKSLEPGFPHPSFSFLTRYPFLSCVNSLLGWPSQETYDTVCLSVRTE